MNTGLRNITPGVTEARPMVVIMGTLLSGEINGIATMDTGIPGKPGRHTGKTISTGFARADIITKTAICFSGLRIRVTATLFSFPSEDETVSKPVPGPAQGGDARQHYPIETVLMSTTSLMPD
jgi:hypothetical protein